MSAAPPPEKIEPVKKAKKPVSLDHVRSALNETKEERDKRIKKLFSLFDSNNVGYLDSSKIEKGLSQMRIPSDYKFAKELLKVCDANQDGRVDFDEFRKYTDDKEMELYLIFQAIDAEHNGTILPEELLDALGKAGIEIDDNELASFVDRIDKDNNGIITFEEWRDFLLLCPHEATIKNIYGYWEKVYLIDIGESAVIPEGISNHLHATKYLIAGGIAGAASRTATAPLDRLKVSLQVQTKKAAIGPAVKSILKEGGLLGFFRGNGLNVFKVTPESAIKFYAYESFKNVIGDADANGNVGSGGRLVAGGLAGAVAQTFIYPMDLVKTRLQTFEGTAPGLAKLTRDIWVQEGPRAFYRGLFPSLIGIIPYAGIDLSAYESLKEMSKKYIHQDSEPGPLVPLACGMLSGSIGAMSVYPLQVIRTRMQAQRMKSTMSEVFWRTYRNEGPRGFYKGLFPNLLKVVPAASITYTVYEAMKKSLDLE